MQLFLTLLGLSDSFPAEVLEVFLITRTMLLIAIRQRNWIEAESMATELENDSNKDMMKAVKKAASDAVKDSDRAKTLLRLWAELKWLEINEN